MLPGSREEKREYWAVIAAAAITAAGSATAATVSSQGAKAAAKAGKGQQHKVPLTPYQNAFERHLYRELALNQNAQPPSFADYIQSGGTATFPITDPGYTPKELRSLGMVGPRGQQIPFGLPSESQLTPQQALYLGYQQNREGLTTPNTRAYALNQRIQQLLGQQQTTGRTAREQRLRARRDQLISGGFSGGLA